MIDKVDIFHGFGNGDLAGGTGRIEVATHRGDVRDVAAAFERSIVGGGYAGVVS